MRQVKRKMPIYTGDVSAVAAALYELGGMVVMHDASGCNSTYNSHDELRWYDRESLIYISGLNHIDAIMGNDEKLIRDIAEAAKELKPRFIAIASTPIPYIMGTDFGSITREIHKRTGIPCFFVPTNGTHSYVYGAGEAFLGYAKAMLQTEKTKKEKKEGKLQVNLLGVTPLDFGLTSFTESVKSWLLENDMQMKSCFALNLDAPEEADGVLEGDVNLVVSSTGYAMAKYLEEQTGIPYVIGTPVEGWKDEVAKTLQRAAKTGESLSACERRQEKEAEIYIVGEPVISASLACAITKSTGKSVRVLVPNQCPKELLTGMDQIAEEEEELTQLLKGARGVIADELLKPFCNSASVFHALPHVACSGRVFAEQMPDLTHYFAGCNSDEKHLQCKR